MRAMAGQALPIAIGRLHRVDASCRGVESTVLKGTKGTGDAAAFRGLVCGRFPNLIIAIFDCA